MNWFLLPVDNLEVPSKGQTKSIRNKWASWTAASGALPRRVGYGIYGHVLNVEACESNT